MMSWMLSWSVPYQARAHLWIATFAGKPHTASSQEIHETDKIQDKYRFNLLLGGSNLFGGNGVYRFLEFHIGQFPCPFGLHLQP